MRLGWPRPKAERKRQRALDRLLAAERAATLAGLDCFDADRAGGVRSSALLRRNVHRLEKGLCFPDRRAVFGEKFIEDTVRLYAAQLDNPQAEPAERAWAHDTLARYFAAVTEGEGTPAARARAAWDALPPQAAGAPAHAPYPFSDIDSALGVDSASAADYDAFFALARSRRSLRWFRPDPVPVEMIERAVAAAVQAPSACNRQPFTYHLARTPGTIGRIADLPLGTAGFGRDLPALIAVMGDLSMYADARDRHLPYIDAALATMQLMLALSAQRLGSVPINWPDIPANHAALREILGLGPHRVPVMLVGLGWPDPDCPVAFSAKRPVEDVLHVHD